MVSNINTHVISQKKTTKLAFNYNLKNMDADTSAFVGALVSVAFGWFLNELGQWFRTRKEDKKIKKEVLFNLLETHYTFRQLDINEYINLITDAVLELYPEEQRSEQLRQELHNIYTQMIAETLKQIVDEKLPALEIKYTNAIEGLAKIDPITAYRLNGKTNIMQVFKNIEASFDTLAEIFPEENTEVQNQAERALNYFKPNALTEAISDLENDLRSIAWTINPITYWKIRKTLKSYLRARSKEARIEVDKLVGSIAQEMGLKSSDV